MKKKNKFETLDEFKEYFFPQGFKNELILRETKKPILALPSKVLNKISKDVSKV